MTRERFALQSSSRYTTLSCPIWPSLSIPRQLENKNVAPKLGVNNGSSVFGTRSPAPGRKGAARFRKRHEEATGGL